MSAPVVISGYPSPLYDELYKKWRKVSFNVANHVAKGKKKSRATECIWMNY